MDLIPVLNLPRPWAWRIVLGRDEVLNLPRRVSLPDMRTFAVNAMRQWDARGGEDDDGSPAGVIGFVRFSRIAPAEDVDLPGVRGKYAAIYAGSTVLETPYDIGGYPQPYRITLINGDRDLGNMLTPAAWRQRQQQRANDAAILAAVQRGERID